MSASRKELLVYGFIREYFAINDIELPPDDLMVLFVCWVILMDSFDKKKCHKAIKFGITDTRITFRRTQYSSVNYVTAIGTAKVKKGCKEQWRFQSHAAYPIIGIISAEIVASKNNIADHSNRENGGYGLQSTFWDCYHASTVRSRQLKEYASQFKVDKLPFIITMELDMTQIANDNGVLRYFFHERAEDVKKIWTDGKYTNIAFDDIDINGEYMLAVGVSTSEPDRWIELLP